MAPGINDELSGQFSRTWRTLREIVECTPEAEWQTGNDGYLVPARLVYHILATADIYSTDLDYEEYKSLRVYTLNWETAPLQDFPSQATMLTRIASTEEKVRQWLASLDDAAWLRQEQEYIWTGKTVLGRAIYVLMHNQHHIGEINAELRRRGLRGGRW